MAEMQFLLFFIFRPWPKHSFYHFHAFGHGRKHVFAVFYSSAMAESHFSPFSRFRPRPTSKIINLGDYWAVHSCIPNSRLEFTKFDMPMTPLSKYREYA